MSVMQATPVRAQIVSYYKKATYCYAAPFVLLVLFFPVGLMTLLPLSLAGLYFTKCGLALATKNGDQEKKDVGNANLLLGAIILTLGLIGLALALLMTA